MGTHQSSQSVNCISHKQVKPVNDLLDTESTSKEKQPTSRDQIKGTKVPIMACFKSTIEPMISIAVAKPVKSDPTDFDKVFPGLVKELEKF